MDYQPLLVAAVLALGFASLAESSRADVIATDTGITVKESDVATPHRGMTMDQVAGKFGAPVTKVAAVGSPPISRWEYPGFVVYFEHEHVIHSVVSSEAAADASAPASAPAAPAPAADSTPAADSAPAASPASAPAADSAPAATPAAT
jgi:outer membrane protein assembly factor BamE (lipoprotein component of BamABCDE complex)